MKIVHITTVHPRDDVRIRYKYVLSLANIRGMDTILVVADGLGPEAFTNYKIKDLGKSSFGRIGRFIIGNYKVFVFGVRNKYDLLHFHDPELLPVAALLKIIGKKVIFDMHENLPLQILTKNYLSCFIRKILSQISSVFQRMVLKSMPVIFAEISYIKYFTFIRDHELILNYPLKQVLTGISEEKEKIFTVGYMGGVSIERGAIVILDAVRNLRKEGQDIEVVFVGAVDEELLNSNIYITSQEEGWAYFKGRLEPMKGWATMAKCHIGLAVLENSPNFLESYPTKLFEYMLLKLPVITSNFPLYKAIIEESNCGILVDPSSASELGEAIKKIKREVNESRQMGENGRAIAVQKYNWETEFEKALKFYRSIL